LAVQININKYKIVEIISDLLQRLGERQRAEDYQHINGIFEFVQENVLPDVLEHLKELLPQELFSYNELSDDLQEVNLLMKRTNRYAKSNLYQCFQQFEAFRGEINVYQSFDSEGSEIIQKSHSPTTLFLQAPRMTSASS
jgi:hypothetical protein